MVERKLAVPLQTLVLAVLAFNTTVGAEIATQVKTSHFDAVYRDFAAQLLRYRRQYGTAPGRAHLRMLVANAAMGKDNDLVKKQLLPELLAQEDTINARYVADRTHEFVRKQVLKDAIIAASERYGTDDVDMLPEVEKIFFEALKFRTTGEDAGVFITDPKALRFLNKTRVDFVPLDIPVLDQLHIGLTPKELLLYIAAKGTGKSWFCVHAGKQAVLQNQNVVHVTLEMSAEQVIGRYFQAMFSITRSPEKYVYHEPVFDDLKETLVGWHKRRRTPKLDFTNPKIRKILKSKMGKWGARFGGLVIKEYPTRALTVEMLVNYLDYLESAMNYTPHVLIVDYPKLMRIDSKNQRIDLGRTVEDLRGIAVQRNLALVCPHQGTRATIGASRVRSSQASEDISVVQTADNVLAYSCTSAEQELGVARLSVEHARNAKSGAMAVLFQSYTAGQYVIDSAPMSAEYAKKIRAEGNGDDEEEDE